MFNQSRNSVDGDSLANVGLEEGIGSGLARQRK